MLQKHPKYGGGRPPGGLNRATLEIKKLAREYGPAGIARLAEIAFEDPPGELEAVETLKVMFKEGNVGKEEFLARRGGLAAHDSGRLLKTLTV